MARDGAGSSETLEQPSGLTEVEEALHSQGIRLVCGVDEAGRGPLAGPVVAAAVLFLAGVWVSGVRDSKVLSPDRRTDLDSRIRRLAVSVAVASASVREIDEMNIFEACRLAMRRAILMLRPEPEYCLIDGPWPVPDLSIPQRPIVDGDALCHAISAAGIVAKVARDRMMEELDAQYPQYGFASHKGYATRAHIEALTRFGPSPVHRNSFRPVAQAKKAGAL